MSKTLMKYYGNYSGNKQLNKSYDPLLEEKKTLNFWTKKCTFAIIQENRLKENDGTSSFHWGPPFLTGSPHCGHILNGILKDIFTRYGFQKNLQVVSQFGWDCHGLAVEHEVNKRLNIKTPENMEQIGVNTYNDECRKFVQRHQVEWKKIFDRMGIWVDFTSAYSTMSAEYMEGVWCIFKQLYDQSLVYRQTKVLPYSTGCFSHLSDFEADMNWKETIAVSTTISVNIENSNGKFKLLFWTTDPWLMGVNVAACVNPNAKYVKVKMLKCQSTYILSKNRMPIVFPNCNEYEVLEEIKGEHLSGLRYQPLFGCLTNPAQIIADDCVREDLGTGIMPISPYFSEDGYRICQENGIAFEDVLCPMDNSGHFNHHISELAGLSINEANAVVVDSLQRRGQVVHMEDIRRRIRHCWRSDVPLIHKATSTWFIKTDNFSNNNSQVLNDAAKYNTKDWTIGRKKYWGTPIPIWSSASGDETVCLGSIEELIRLTGRTDISDLHRESIDDLQIPSSIPGNPSLRRVTDVFDCWFESSVMPFIQQRSQVDFIVEGLDQVSGWFYTTSFLASSLGLPRPSKNVVAHGLVCASDGTKVSKRKHNHADVIRIAEKYGADALRLYLVTTPLVSGQSFTIQEAEIGKMLDSIIHPVYQILYELMPRFGKEGWVSYGVINSIDYITDILDIWILSCAESLVQFYDTEMAAYRFERIIPRIIELVAQVRDWYIPLKNLKDKTKKGKITSDGSEFLLFNIVYRICMVLSPFAPFFTEHIYQMLQPFVGHYFRREFLHDSLLPLGDKLIQKKTEEKVAQWQIVVELVREFRVNNVIPFGYRINELIVYQLQSDLSLDDNELLQESMMELENIHKLTISKDRCQFGAVYKADLKANSSLSANVSLSELEEISTMIRKLSDEQIEEALQYGSIEFRQHSIPLEDIRISFSIDTELEKNPSIATKEDILVFVRMNKGLDFYEEGTRQELISCVQKVKKKAKAFHSEQVTIYYSTEDKCIRNAFQKYSEDLKTVTNSHLRWLNSANDTLEGDALKEIVLIKGAPVTMQLLRNDLNISI